MDSLPWVLCFVVIAEQETGHWSPVMGLKPVESPGGIGRIPKHFPELDCAIQTGCGHDRSVRCDSQVGYLLRERQLIVKGALIVGGRDGMK